MDCDRCGAGPALSTEPKLKEYADPAPERPRYLVLAERSYRGDGRRRSTLYKVKGSDGSHLAPDGLVTEAALLPEAASANLIADPSYLDREDVTLESKERFRSVAARVNAYFASKEELALTFKDLKIAAMEPMEQRIRDTKTGASEVVKILGLYDPATRTLYLSKDLPESAIEPVLCHELVHYAQHKTGGIYRALSEYGERKGREFIEREAHDAAGALVGEPRLARPESVDSRVERRARALTNYLYGTSEALRN